MRKLIESMDSINEDLNEPDVRITYDAVQNNEISYFEFLDWDHDIRYAAKREVE